MWSLTVIEELTHLDGTKVSYKAVQTFSKLNLRGVCKQKSISIVYHGRKLAYIKMCACITVTVLYMWPRYTMCQLHVASYQ